MDIPSIDKSTELYIFINNNLKPKQLEKQENGEVFTPIYIIEELLDNLNKHYNHLHNKDIWTNKNLKWFDPAVGIGNFIIVLYYKLLNGLKNIIPNEIKRKKHIIENMLYMSELNQNNCSILKNIFINYKINLNEEDTLKLNVFDKWKIKNFDVIIGNPPYNKGGIKSHTGSKLGEKNDTIWPLFIKYSLNILKEKGYLVFINPLSWLRKSHSVHKLILEKHIVWLKLWAPVLLIKNYKNLTYI